MQAYGALTQSFNTAPESRILTWTCLTQLQQLQYVCACLALPTLPYLVQSHAMYPGTQPVCVDQHRTSTRSAAWCLLDPCFAACPLSVCILSTTNGGRWPGVSENRFHEFCRKSVAYVITYVTYRIYYVLTLIDMYGGMIL